MSRRRRQGAGDSPVLNAPRILGAYEWWRTDPSTISEATGCDAWTGKIGGRDATEAVAANQPLVIKTGGLKGRWYLQFDGTNDILNIDAIAADLWDSDLTVFTVCTLAGAAGQKCVFSIGNNTTPAQYMQWGEVFGVMNIQRYNPLTTLVGAIPFATGNSYYCMQRYDHVNIDESIDGVAEPSVAFAGDPAVAGNVAAIGALKRNTVANYFNGNLYELVVFDRALNPQEQGLMNLYLSSFYGL